LGELLALKMPEGTKPAARHFGYLVGRWVYLCDAADDFEKDRHSGNFNPLASKESAANALNAVNDELFPAYEAWQSAIGNRQSSIFKGIYENILTYGLEHVKQKIYAPKKYKGGERGRAEENERSL
jgi:hypothetical protein